MNKLYKAKANLILLDDDFAAHVLLYGGHDFEDISKNEIKELLLNMRSDNWDKVHWAFEEMICYFSVFDEPYNAEELVCATFSVVVMFNAIAMVDECAITNYSAIFSIFDKLKAQTDISVIMMLFSFCMQPESLKRFLDAGRYMFDNYAELNARNN